MRHHDPTNQGDPRTPPAQTTPAPAACPGDPFDSDGLGDVWRVRRWGDRRFTLQGGGASAEAFDLLTTTPDGRPARLAIARSDGSERLLEPGVEVTARDVIELTIALPTGTFLPPVLVACGAVTIVAPTTPPDHPGDQRHSPEGSDPSDPRTADLSTEPDPSQHEGSDLRPPGMLVEPPPEDRHANRLNAQWYL